MDLIPALQDIWRSLGFEGAVAAHIAVFGLALARLVTAVSLAPFLGGKGVPSQVKMGVAGALTILLFPLLEPVTRQELSIVLWVALLAKEVLIGALLGLLVQLVFFGIQMAGTVIDTQRGMNQFSFFAPQLEGNTSALGLLKFQAALVIFLLLDGHLIFVEALADSFVSAPVTQFPAFDANGALFVDRLARFSAETFVIALKLAAPVLIALFLIDASFGALGKIAPQMPVHGEAHTLKGLAGLVIVVLGLPLILRQFRVSMVDMLAGLQSVIGLMGGV
jgi:flagellar biosynthetic protein FliR